MIIYDDLDYDYEYDFYDEDDSLDEDYCILNFYKLCDGCGECL